MDCIHLLGVTIHRVTVTALHQEIARLIHGRQPAAILNVNVNAMNIAAHDASFRNILNTAGLVFCDGAGVRLGAWIMGLNLPPRITYADWIYQLAEYCSQEGFSLFLLGGKPGIAQQAAQNLQQKFPRLKIVGQHHGYFEKQGPANQSVIRAINQAQPDILLVCFGMPEQEKWIANYKAKIKTYIFLSGGAVLDYVAGRVPRAPQWMLAYGLEWLFRLGLEPGRMWRRYVIGNPSFLWRVFQAWLKKVWGQNQT